MKNLFCVLLLSATVILGSCTKNNISPRLAEKEGMKETYDAMQGFSYEVLADIPMESIVPGLPNDCLYHECSDKISDWLDINQPIAEDLCETQFGEVTCCMSNIWVSMQVKAEPQSINCLGTPEINLLPLEKPTVK